jgi:hypothetical protein
MPHDPNREEAGGVAQVKTLKPTTRADGQIRGAGPSVRRMLRRLVATASDGWRSAMSTWREYPSYEATVPDLAAIAPGARRTWRQRIFTRRVVATLLVVGVLLLACGGLNLHNMVDAYRSVKDARAQYAMIKTIAKAGGYTNPDTLRAIQPHLDSLASDIDRLQADIPGAGALAALPGVGDPVHLLRMASALVHAGQVALPAAIVLAPQLKGFLFSVQANGAPTSDDSKAVPPPTLADVTMAAAALDRVGPYIQTALAERAHVSDTMLKLAGFSSLIPLLHQVDAYAPNLPQYLAALHAIDHALPDLLGVSKPATFVLFNQDSDELRATGGFMGNYALLTLDKARLTSGVHLTDIYQLDCPNGGAGHCPLHPIPPQFAWLQTSPDHFGLRDSNVDPDFPTSARYAEDWLAHDGAPPVDGVIAITPKVIQQILEVTGPVTVPQFCAVVTPETLADLIHYFHQAAQLGITSLCPKQQVAAEGGNKGFDAVLGSQLLHRVAILPPAQQNALGKLLAKDLLTKDVQIYVNDPGVEAMLGSFGIDGAVKPMPSGSDGLMVVDVNTDATYANADVTEHLTDAVSLGADGSATHHLTIDYQYPKSSHLYTDVYEANLGYWSYRDFVRVIVPDGARLLSQDGCTPYDTTESGHAVWACIIGFGQPKGLTLHFTWTVPHAVAKTDGGQSYHLYLQRQAGAHVSFDVSIAGAPGSVLQKPPHPPLVAAGGNRVSLSTALPQNQLLVVDYTR